MPLNPLDFVSDFTKYPADSPPPNYPGESTNHMRTSGDWLYTAAPVRNQAGTVTFNDVAYGPGMLGVANATPGPTAVAWTLSTSFGLTWPAGGPANFRIASAGGVTDPPPGGNPPGVGASVAVYLTRSGSFFTDGQTVSHSETNGAAYTGGPLTVRVEVTRHGPWWVRVSGGAAERVFCGDVWGGGELTSGTFGVGDPSGTGAIPLARLTTDSVTGATSTRVGPAVCPHLPPVGGGARTQVFWVPGWE